MACSNETMDRLAALYDSYAVVCLNQWEIMRILRLCRGKEGVTGQYERQRDLCIRAGVPIGTLSKLEAGPETASIETLKRVAAAHSLDVAVVFYRSPNQQKDHQSGGTNGN